MAFPVVFDADVLYGIEVTDFFLTLATERMFRPHWSPQILDEVRRNLRRRPELNPAAIDRRLEQMNLALPDALAEAPRSLIRAMPVNRKDRHVLALAVHVGAATLVTNNLRHFTSDACAPYGVEAINPDDFGVAQIDLDPITVTKGITTIAQRRTRAPKTGPEIMERLARELPKSMEALHAYLAWAEGGPDPR
ncbi:MAG: PIN domain-containing protein [Acidimicrobiia bacterium]|nr:PIN domain-containing protein [Acidimicrobiia bacterium]